MNSYLLNRQIGSISPQAFALAQNNRLLKSLQRSADVNFKSLPRENSVSTHDHQRDASSDIDSSPHKAGISSITVDRFEGRYLLSAGADSSIAIWDLERTAARPGESSIHRPVGHAARSSTTESLGITHISFYPFDSLAFLTSGYDRCLKIFSSEALATSASFDLGSVVYSHSVSTVASHLLVACASQHPAVRLVDLKSGSSSHSLAGHSGSVLVVAWHPRHEHVLASGATDGSLRVWDIRRSASSLGVLDMEDSVGIAGYDGKGTGARRRERGKAHNGAVNGITWTEDGLYLVSTGHDERTRVWDMTTGANTLANFGPWPKNAHTTPLFPLLAPSYLSPASSETVFFPNPSEILSYDLHAGKLLSRLRVADRQPKTADSGSRNLTPRTTSLAWRTHQVEMYSGHADGVIRCWRPRTREDIEIEQEDKEECEDAETEAERKRKREELEQIVRDLTKRRTTYS